LLNAVKVIKTIKGYRRDLMSNILVTEVKTVTVEDNANAVIDKRVLGKPFSWTQLNRKAEELWKDKNKLEYVGAVQGVNKKMYCVFQEMIRNSNNTFKVGEIYKVENDVVFDYQKTKKPVKTGQKIIIDSEMDD
jgi:hypothetical protein